MNDVEKYLFDLNGYLLVKGLLDRDSAKRCLDAANVLEDQIVAGIDEEPSYIGHFGLKYHFDETLGYSSYKNDWGGGPQYIADDFLNASDAFDVLVGHRPTMSYVDALGMGPFQIGSSELRFRHTRNVTLTHMGGSIDARNRYVFAGRQIIDSGSSERRHRDFDLLCIRIIYALHDIPMEQGPLCVVPGSHKSNFYSPYGSDPTKEPGMVGIPMEAGDALFFTENLRHGGFPNQVDRPRTTIHFMISPTWAASQSPAHWNRSVYVSPAAWKRYDEYQRSFFPSPNVVIPPIASATASGSTVDELRLEITRLQQQVHLLQHHIESIEASSSWRLVAALRKGADIAHRAKRRLRR